MDIRKHWDRWIWLIPAAVIVIVALRLLFAERPFCSADVNENCFREWISALGGWAAVAAAVPTVLYLSKQVFDAERFARITIRMNTLPTIEHAKHIVDLSNILRNAIHEGKKEFGEIPSKRRDKDIMSLRVRTAVVISFLERSELHEASREFQTRYGAQMLLEILRRDNAHVEKLRKEDTNERCAARRDAVLKSLTMVEKFCDELSTKASLRAAMAEEVIRQT